jgi:hypothetical protein
MMIKRFKHVVVTDMAPRQKDDAPFPNSQMILEWTLIGAWVSRRLENMNNCADEDQQQLSLCRDKIARSMQEHQPPESLGS